MYGIKFHRAPHGLFRVDCRLLKKACIAKSNAWHVLNVFFPICGEA
jgi:hypothetical protein